MAFEHQILKSHSVSIPRYKCFSDCC